MSILTPLPTPKELLILSVLWNLGPSTARQIHTELKNKQQTTTYTTTLKMMQVMYKKGLLKKNSQPMAHIYSPSVNQKSTQRALIHDLIDRAFNGNQDNFTELLKDL